MTFDESKPVKVAGKVTRLTLSNPVSTMIVDGPAGHIFALAAPADMMRQGFTKMALLLGDQVEVSGVLAAGGQNIDGSLAARADLVTVNGIIVFDRSKLVASSGQPNGNDTRKLELKMLLVVISEMQKHLDSIQTSYSDDNPEVVRTKAQIVQEKAQVDALKREIANDGPAK